MHKTKCSSDPFPAKVLMNHLEVIMYTIVHVVNLSLTTGGGGGGGSYIMFVVPLI